MAIHCPLCNRSSDDVRFIGEFCEICLRDQRYKGLPETVKLNWCKFCDRIEVGKTYVEKNPNTLARGIELAYHKSNCRVDVVGQDGRKAKAIFIFDIEGEKLRVPKEVLIVFQRKTCDLDYKKSSGYYEAEIQVRGDMLKVDRFTNKVIDYAENHGAFIARVEDVRNGKDVYVSDKLLVNQFFMLYRKKYKPTKSYTLKTIKGGRKVYRNTYAVRFDND